MCATGIVFLQAAIAPSLFVSDPQLFCPLTTQSPNTLYCIIYTFHFYFCRQKKIAKSLDISSWAVKSLDLVFNFSGLHWTKKYINAIQIYYVYKYPCWELFFDNKSFYYTQKPTNLDQIKTFFTTVCGLASRVHVSDMKIETKYLTTEEKDKTAYFLYRKALK